MTKTEIIEGLKSLIEEAEAYIMPDDPEDSIFREDKQVLEEAIKIIRKENVKEL
jgi:hypothetical protein